MKKRIAEKYFNTRGKSEFDSFLMYCGMKLEKSNRRRNLMQKAYVYIIRLERKKSAWMRKLGLSSIGCVPDEVSVNGIKVLKHEYKNKLRYKYDKE